MRSRSDGRWTTTNSRRISSFPSTPSIEETNVRVHSASFSDSVPSRQSQSRRFRSAENGDVRRHAEAANFLAEPQARMAYIRHHGPSPGRAYRDTNKGSREQGVSNPCQGPWGKKGR